MNILIDTYPLLEHLYWQCKEKFGWEFLKNELHVLKSKDQVKRFGKFLRNRRLFVISSVIAEIQGHQRRLFNNKVKPNLEYQMQCINLALLV